MIAQVGTLDEGDEGFMTPTLRLFRKSFCLDRDLLLFQSDLERSQELVRRWTGWNSRMGSRSGYTPHPRLQICRDRHHVRTALYRHVARDVRTTPLPDWLSGAVCLY